jgi:hypothetical protein
LESAWRWRRSEFAATCPDARAKLGRIISPEFDVEGATCQLDENETLRFGAVEIGHVMRTFYVQGGSEPAMAALSGGNQAALDQLIGAHAVSKDLAGVLDNGKIEANKAAALDHLGLLELETNEDGSSTYKVTDDALGLVPPALREAVANDTTGKYNFKVMAGNPGAMANNLVKSGEDRLRSAADNLTAKAQVVEGQSRRSKVDSNSASR